MAYVLEREAKEHTIQFAYGLCITHEEFGMKHWIALKPDD